MTISYPLSLPDAPSFSSFSLRATDVVAMSRSEFTGTQQVQQHQGQWWSADMSLPPMYREDAEQWIAFLTSLNGMVGTFLMGDPLGASPRGLGGGTPVVDGASQTGNQLDIDGAVSLATGWLLPGDYIQLGTGTSTRLHKVLTSADTDSDGRATLDIWPSLRSSPANAAPVIITSAKGIFRLASNDREFSTAVAGIYGISFSALEAL